MSTGHWLAGLTNRSIQLVGGEPVVRSLDRKRCDPIFYSPTMMLKGVRHVSPLSLPRSRPHYPPQADTPINWGCFAMTCHEGACESARPRARTTVWLDSPEVGCTHVQARRLYYAILSRYSTKEFDAGNRLLWACYTIGFLCSAAC